MTCVTKPDTFTQTCTAQPKRRAALFGLWHARFRQRQTLARLEPYLLRDIGVTPQEAKREASKPFWRA
ncbi:MAG: DUF1127 domain-containing protein [Pseudomonadota bacterium]